MGDNGSRREEASVSTFPKGVRGLVGEWRTSAGVDVATRLVLEGMGTEMGGIR